MMIITLIAHICAFAFTAALAVSGFMIALRITDAPNARSAHSVPTPSAGGVGIVAGMIAAVIALRLFYPDSFNDPILPLLGGAGLLIASIGLFDDIKALPPLVKGVCIAVISLITPLWVGVPQGLPLGVMSWTFPYALAYGGSVLWIFVVINLVNFMDGANGLMGGVMLIASAALGALAFFMAVYDVAIIAFVLAAAVAGFLVYNFRTTARIFCGDVGALFIGFIFAAAVLRLCSHPHGAAMLYAGPLLILPILTDGLLTMLVRAREKQALLSAHNTHIYQRLIRGGAGHVKIALIYAGFALACAVWVLFASRSGLIASASFFMMAVLVASLIYVRARRALERR